MKISPNPKLYPHLRNRPEQMIEVHDLFLRAIAVPTATKKNKKRTKDDVRESEDFDDPKWPEEVIAIDTESRLGVGQSLTFGVWQRCKLVGGRYEVIEEGIFYADDLPARELTVLRTRLDVAVPDARSFPPRFPLYSRTQFMKKVFWPGLKKRSAMVVGFNLGYDLTRLALDWEKGNKGEWSLVMMRYADGNENCNYPRILITPIDSKKQIIKLWRPWKKKWRPIKDAGVCAESPPTGPWTIASKGSSSALSTSAVENAWRKNCAGSTKNWSNSSSIAHRLSAKAEK